MTGPVTLFRAEPCAQSRKGQQRDNYTLLPLCGGSRFRVAASAETIYNAMYLSGEGTTMSFSLTFYFGKVIFN